MDALAESYAAELIKFGIDTVIVVPGAYTSGTNHFAHAGQAADTGRAAAYDANYGELREGDCEVAPTASWPTSSTGRTQRGSAVR
jgi:NAD(P)-dependent dehydrogenase (short-subunit alcohol dehydrogenase family)